MRKTIAWLLPRAATAGLALGMISLTSCAKSRAAPALLDLSAAALDTVTTINDDRTALVALARTGGRQALLSDTAPFLEILGAPDGPVRFGTSGDGPGELRFPSGITWSGDSLFVWDPSQGRLTVFNGAGRLLGVLSVSSAFGKIAPRLLRDGFGGAGRITAMPGGGVALARYDGAVRQPFGLWSTTLVRVSPGGALDTLAVAFSPVDQLRALNDDAQELVAVPLWASCGALGLATWDPVGQLLRRYPASGTAGRTDSVGGLTLALTDEQIKINLRHQLDALLPGKRPEPAVYDQMITSMLESTHGARRTFPKAAPAFVSMSCDDAGTVWLQQFSLTDTGSGLGRTWTLIEPSGAVRAVRLPPDFRVLSIADTAIWGVRGGGEGQLLLLTLPLPTS